MKEYKLYSPGTVLSYTEEGHVIFYTVHHVEILNNGIFYYFESDDSDEFIRMPLNYLEELNIKEVSNKY